MSTEDGGRMKYRSAIALGVLMLAQLLTAAPAGPAQEALQSFCQTFSGRPAVCGPLRRAKRSASVPWSDLLTNSTTSLPDTKWCGVGDTAADYDDLGSAVATDRCCRRHDHCPLYLDAGEARGGLTNTGSFARSDCGCDTEFFNCLVAAQTEHSQVVGELYFNILQPECIKNVASRSSRRERPKQQQQQQLRFVKSPLAGQFPEPHNEEEALHRAETLALKAWSQLVKRGPSD